MLSTKALVSRSLINVSKSLKETEKMIFDREITVIHVGVHSAK